jgi:two-component system NtrC family response regulator
MKNQKATEDNKLELLDKWVKEKRFAEALSVIQECDQANIYARSSIESGAFLYLCSLVFHSLGEYGEALERGKKSFEIFKHSQDNFQLAQLHLALSLIYASLGDLRTAELEIRDAISAFRKVNDSSGLAACFNKLANIYFIRCKFAESIENLKTALEFSKEIGNSEGEIKFLGNLARNYLLLGEFDLAEKYLLQYFATSSELRNPISDCRNQLSLGFLYLKKRNFPQAIECLETAKEIAQKKKLLRELAIYKEYSGELCLAKGETEQAKKHFSQILEEMGNAAPSGDMISQTKRLLAQALFQEGKLEESLKLCQQSQEIALSLGEKLEEGVNYRILGEIYSALGDKEAANSNFRQSVAILRELGTKYELAQTYLAWGKAKSFEKEEKIKQFYKAEELFDEMWCEFEKNLIKEEILFLHQPETKKFINKEKKSHSSNVFFPQVVTQSPKMIEILQWAYRFRNFDSPVLLEGETGTGKGLLALAIHEASQRKNQPFVTVHCPSISETLFESELFGYKKGAFTDAIQDKEGLVDSASQGTLFLDEIGELPLGMQSKIQHLIDKREFWRVGDNKPIRAEFRIIAATNRDLEKEIKQGNFRRDLFYRLNSCRLVLPPLRERREDIPLLAHHFANGNQAFHQKIEELLERWIGSDWLGNVREIRDEVQRWELLFEENPELNFSGGDIMPSRFQKTDEFNLMVRLNEFEKELIIKALRQAKGVKSRAADLLDIDESTLRYKMKKHEILELD